MSVAIKLLILAIINLAAMACLLIKLMNLGNNFPASLRLAWDLILGQPQSQLNRHPDSAPIWAPVLRKTWWLMLIAYVISWLITDDLGMAIGLILLVLIHVVWYLYASFTLKTKYDRVLHLTSDWGIVYQEIGSGSSLIQKSLADLDLRKKNLLVLVIERNNQLTPFPKGVEIIQAGDRVVMFGDLNAYHAVSW